MDEKVELHGVMWPGDDGRMHTVALGVDYHQELKKAVKGLRRKCPDLTDEEAVKRVLEDWRRQQRADEGEE